MLPQPGPCVVSAPHQQDKWGPPPALWDPGRGGRRKPAPRRWGSGPSWPSAAVTWQAVRTSDYAHASVLCLLQAWAPGDQIAARPVAVGPEVRAEGAGVPCSPQVDGLPRAPPPFLPVPCSAWLTGGPALQAPLGWARGESTWPGQGEAWRFLDQFCPIPAAEQPAARVWGQHLLPWPF